MKMAALPLAVLLLLLVAGASAGRDDRKRDPYPEVESPPPEEYQSPPPMKEHTKKPKPTHGCTKPGDWDKKGLKDLKQCPAKDVVLNPSCVKVECEKDGYAKVVIKNCIPLKKKDTVKFISICYDGNCYRKKNVGAGEKYFRFKAKCNSKFTLAFFDEDYKGSHDSYTSIRKSDCSGHYNDKQMCKTCGIYEYKIVCPPAVCESDPKYPCFKKVDNGYCGCKKVPVPKDTVVCREKYGKCDVEEYCDGEGKCPEDKYLTDLKKPCRKSAHKCDAPEYCTGYSRHCPEDQCVASYPPKE